MNSKPRLLIAEDHPKVRAMIVSLLERDFDVVASVSNGQAALEAANTLLPDVVILDVSMPILDGREVARHLKAQGCIAKLVFLSLFSDVDQVNSFLAAGGDACVSKVRMATDLFCAIQEVLAGKTFVSPMAG
jgi:DNA-binding NarL/FixJ family response regulator